MNNLIPASVESMRIVAELMKRLADVFNIHSPHFLEWNAEIEQLKSGRSLDESSSETMILYIQLCWLLSASMENSLLNAFIKQIKIKNDKIAITWKNNTTSQCHIGKFDDQCRKFFLSCKYTILQDPPQKKDEMTFRDLLRIQDKIQNDLVLINQIKQQIAPILNNQISAKDLINQNQNDALLFIILSVLPADVLNAFFIHIQQYFPEELAIKSPTGSTIQITSLFQSSTQDLLFLIEKVKVYFKLYRSTEMPIIRHITQNQSKAYLSKILENRQVETQLHTNLEAFARDQLDSRIVIFMIWLNHLKLILA